MAKIFLIVVFFWYFEKKLQKSLYLLKKNDESYFNLPLEYIFDKNYVTIVT